MTHAHGRVQVDERGVARGLRVPIGHADDDGFLQAEHVTEVGRKLTEHQQFGGPGIAEHRGHAEFAQQAEGLIADGRCGHRASLAASGSDPSGASCYNANLDRLI
jgi:hypothetical protein